jgi:hypothetical protein
MVTRGELGFKLIMYHICTKTMLVKGKYMPMNLIKQKK